MKQRLLFIILLITGIAVWYGYTEYNRTNRSLKDAKATATVTAPVLLAAYERDSASAVKQYNDHVIAVSGTVKKIEATDNPVIIFLGDAAQMSSVQCSMDSTNAETYNVLKTGSTATLKGTVTGFRSDPLFGTDVILFRCVVEKAP